jgi:hypothetical protein
MATQKQLWLHGVLVCCVFVLVAGATTGCTVIELEEAGALELGTEVGIVTPAEVAAISEAEEMGLAMRALPEGGIELAAEDSLVPGALRNSLSRLAARSGVVLGAENGAVTFSGSNLVITEEGVIGLRGARGPIDVIGRLDRGVIYEFARSDLTVDAVGRLRAVVRHGSVPAVASPDTSAVVRQVLRPGNVVDVLRVNSSWYEVRVGPQETAWVPTAEMLLLLAFKKEERPAPGPWKNSADPSSPIANFVLEQYDHAKRCTSANDPLMCFNFKLPQGVYFEQYPGLSGDALDGRMVRVLWESPIGAIVEIKQQYREWWDKREHWECEKVLLSRPPKANTEDAAPDGDRTWVLEKRGAIWTCGEKNPYGEGCVIGDCSRRGEETVSLLPRPIQLKSETGRRVDPITPCSAETNDNSTDYVHYDCPALPETVTTFMEEHGLKVPTVIRKFCLFNPERVANPFVATGDFDGDGLLNYAVDAEKGKYLGKIVVILGNGRIHELRGWDYIYVDKRRGTIHTYQGDVNQEYDSIVGVRCESSSAFYLYNKTKDSFDEFFTSD